MFRGNAYCSQKLSAMLYNLQKDSEKKTVNKTVCIELNNKRGTIFYSVPIFLRVNSQRYGIAKRRTLDSGRVYHDQHTSI